MLSNDNVRMFVIPFCFSSSSLRSRASLCFSSFFSMRGSANKHTNAGWALKVKLGDVCIYVQLAVSVVCLTWSGNNVYLCRAGNGVGVLSRGRWVRSTPWRLVICSEKVVRAWMPKTEEREAKPKLLIHHYIKNEENEKVKIQKSELFRFETPKTIDNYCYQLHWWSKY